MVAAVAVATIDQAASSQRSEMELRAAVAVLGFTLVAWEVLRRRGRLVLYLEQDTVAVYRRGLLVDTCSAVDVGLYVPDRGNTVGIVIGLGFFVALAIVGVVFVESIAPRILSAWAAATLVGSVVSSLRTRHRHTLLILPVVVRRSMVMVTPADGARLLTATTA